jgi:hypothetical protein
MSSLSSLSSISVSDLSTIHGGVDKRSGLEFVYDRVKACAIGALAGVKTIPGPMPAYVKAMMGCTAGVAEQVREEGGFNLDKKPDAPPTNVPPAGGGNSD